MQIFRPQSTAAAALVSALVLGSAARGDAAPDAAPPAAAMADRQVRARERFQAGLTAARRGAWEDARQQFEAAFELVPASSVLFNLAGAQRRTGRLLSSHANYHRCATTADPSLSAEQRRAAQRLADELGAQIPRLRIFVGGLAPGDRITLDNHRIYGNELGRDLWLDPGEHTLRVERDNKPTEARSVSLGIGESRVLSVRLP